MPTLPCEDQLAQFQLFRQNLYNLFPNSRDSVMDLLDALSGNTTATTPVELCEHPSFRRGYSALYKAIGQFFVPSSPTKAVAERKQFQKSLFGAISPLIKAPTNRNFHLLGLDTTPIPRPFSPTLPDRTYIHQPNTIKGNKPINIGHQYSLLSFLPESEGTQNIPWSIPLSTERVNPIQKRYGERFDLKDETTWHQPDEIVQTNFTTRRGRQVQLNISAWYQMLMRGTKEYSMHKHPFTLLQVRVTDEESQQLWHPMWLIVLGQRRNELTIMDCYLSYRQRFDMEHTLRFSKQRLLMNSFQTPDVEHEENWVQLTQLAYIQLWAARDLVSVLPRPKRKILSQKNRSFCHA